MNPYIKKIQDEMNQIIQDNTINKNEKLGFEEIQYLPPPVKRWLEISGAVGMEKARTVWLEQKFLMKLKPEQKKWHQATACQLFSTQNPAFIWAVKLKMAPFLRVTGCDKFIDGKGEMQMKLNRVINLGRSSGVKIDEGTLQRYLGETVWFPSAMISPYIKWENVDENSAKATLAYKNSSGSGIFHFNREGYFEKFSAWRYKDNTAGSTRLEWIINARRYADMNGIKIPVILDATWMLDSGPWTWCNLEVNELRYNFSKAPELSF